MRPLALALVFTGSAIIAQRPAGSGRPINSSAIPRLIYPSGGGPPAVRRLAVAPLTVSPLAIAPLSAAPPLPVTPLAIRPLSAVAPPAVSHPYHGIAAIVPYPVFYGGYYYDYDAPPAPAQGAENDYGYTAQQPSPVVVMNQNFVPEGGPVGPGAYPYGGPVGPGAYPPGAYPNVPPPDQSQAPASPDTSQQVLFFIAMKDHTIFPAVAYWVDGDTLNYITNQGVRNRVSLDLVDVDFSKQLNQQRGVDFALPGMK
ncbi:MAG TPA: hypothetical protein VIY49_16160 [Bryobacteraceae bacterium]